MADKRKCLILLTSSFPYANCETYLECEISKHTENFDKIIILAQETDADAIKTRQVPEGIDVYNTARRSRRAGRTSDLARGIINLPLAHARRYDRAEISGSPVKALFAEYFIQRGARQYRESMAILKKYDFSQFDEVIVYSYNFFGLAYAGAMIKKDLTEQGVKTFLVSRSHAYDTYDCDNSLNYLPLRRFLLKAVDELLVCSDSGRRYISEKYPEFSYKISLSYLGSGDHGTGKYDGIFRIVSCSRMDPEKNLCELVDALALLRNYDNIPEVRWTHIGSGKEEDKVKAYAGKKLDFMKVTFTGLLSNAEVYDYYRKNPVSLFINKSLSEGLPVSIMEATSFGIPVLASNAGGTGELVIDGITGKLTDKNISAEALAGEIVKFASMPEEEYGALRASTRKYWEEHFNADANYKEFSRHIANADSLIAEKGSQYALHS
ncbi:MAG: glycosyltransferase [Clostridiales bacterium]|nr:glycosyltransferase [Clostridiales bacterium]